MDSFKHGAFTIRTFRQFKESHGSWVALFEDKDLDDLVRLEAWDHYMEKDDFLLWCLFEASSAATYVVNNPDPQPGNGLLEVLTASGEKKILDPLVLPKTSSSLAIETAVALRRAQMVEQVDNFGSGFLRRLKLSVFQVLFWTVLAFAGSCLLRCANFLARRIFSTILVVWIPFAFCRVVLHYPTPYIPQCLILGGYWFFAAVDLAHVFADMFVKNLAANEHDKEWVTIPFNTWRKQFAIPLTHDYDFNVIVLYCSGILLSCFTYVSVLIFYFLDTNKP